jgi:hypothetical protein
VEEPAPRREVIGLVFRGLRSELGRRGLLDRVLARLHGPARETLEHPPFHTTWVPAALHDQIVLAIAGEAGRQALRDIVYAVVTNATAPVARPLLKTLLAVFGATPVSLLKNLNRISALQVRGIRFTWTAETLRSGVVTVTHCEPVDPLQFAVWEGVFTFAKDIFGFPVRVETAVPLPDGCSAEIHVGW